MEIKNFHSWSPMIPEAMLIQQELSKKVVTIDAFDQPVRHIAGVDVGFHADGERVKAAVVILSFPDLEVIEERVVEDKVSFPYIPGLFSFRELPPILKALENIETIPDIILCDGQGLAHPRRFGMACHLGVLLGKTTIGVAKTRFIGTHRTVADARGSWESLTDNGEEIGAVLRTQDKINPVYVSIGHNISLSSAISIVLECAPKFRLPETIRFADRLTAF